MQRMNSILSRDSTLPSLDASGGVRLHQFTVPEYHRMQKFGVFKGENPIELLNGRLYIKGDFGPPYGVPLGIPPEDIAGKDVEPFPQRRFTVEEYFRLLDSGALHPELRTELIEGWVVDMMNRNAKHDVTLHRMYEVLQNRVGKKWKVRVQMGTMLDGASPEPDIAVVGGPLDLYEERKPRPIDLALVVEISDSTLSYDRGSKLREYARNEIQCYWIVNVKSAQIEVYTKPSGPTFLPLFHSKKIFKQGESVPLRLEGRNYKPIGVSEIIRRV